MPLVFVVNGDASVREMLASMIRSAGWHCETFADARSFLNDSRAAVPACLLLDAELSDMSGLDLQAQLARRPGLPVVFIAKSPALRVAVLAMKAGAVDFLPEPPDVEQLLGAVRIAFDRSRVALAREAEMRLLAGRYQSLSQREREVMAKIIAGRMNKLIADELGISVITVKAHRGRVMRKMQARSLPHLVNMAARLGPTLLSGDDSCLNPSTANGGGCCGSLPSHWPLPLSPAVRSSLPQARSTP